MDISTMHVWFRQYAQQMGMQNIRAILPEQIDICLNTSIIDIVKRLVKSNIQLTSDGTNTNNKIGPLNALTTLFKTVDVPLYTESSNKDGTKTYTGFKFYAKDKNVGKISGTLDDNIVNSLYILDFSLAYKQINNNSGLMEGTPSTLPVFEDNTETKFYPVRIIDSTLASKSINDFILKNKFNSPIIVNHDLSTYDLYTDKFNKIDDNGTIKYVLSNNYLPYQLQISYIKYPNKVSLTNGISCDLEESVHIDVVKQAVDYFKASISGSMLSQQEQTPQQVNVDSNYNNANTQ
jgi:hypothetical protein